MLDGGDNNYLFTAGIGQEIPLDAVQEFSVITNNFSPQYGRASGGATVRVGVTDTGTAADRHDASQSTSGSGRARNAPRQGSPVACRQASRNRRSTSPPSCSK